MLTVATTATMESDRWSTNDWDFGDNTKFPTLRSYEGSGDNRLQGFILCNQPADHLPCDETTIALRAHVSSIDFGARATAITRQLVIAGRNLNGDITLSPLTVPFSYAEDQALTLKRNSNGFINASIPITLTPTANYQAHTSMITISGGGITPVTVPITGVSVPALEDTDDNGLLEIKYIEQLNVVRNDLDGDYELIRHLDFANASHYASEVVNNAYRPLNNADPTNATATVVANAMGLNPGFPPIGDNSSSSDATRFTGTLEGNGFTISNLYVNNISSANFIYAGLFGRLSTDSEIRNLGLLNAYVQGEGTSSSSVITGGLVGWNNSGFITNCYITGNVSGTGGGSFVDTGGLVGLNSGTIRNCYATGTVTGTGTGSSSIVTGGLVGANIGNITNCYATATVIGKGTGTKSTSGLVGDNQGSGVITNCYWDTETSMQTTSAGGGTGRTTAQMKELTATSTTWNVFDWNFGDNTQYPALRTYKENDSDVQIQGDLICPQPAPRTDAECPIVPNADGISEISTIEDLNIVRNNLGR